MRFQFFFGELIGYHDLMAAHRLGHQQSLESHPYGPMVRIPRLFVDTFWHGFWGLLNMKGGRDIMEGITTDPC